MTRGVVPLLLGCASVLALLACAGGRDPEASEPALPREPKADEPAPAVGPEDASIRIVLGGDVMTGRGVDQLLPHSAPPELYERFVRDARHYVVLAERRHGPLPGLVPFAYPWGVALEALERIAPDVRLVNLETSVTRSERPWPAKGIHYRMHPDNLPVLQAAGIDVCALANNHTLDWGRAGLLETLDSLAQAGIRSAGAGRDAEQAAHPAVLPVAGRGRVVVLSVGLASSGIPLAWAAAVDRPGVNLLPDLSARSVDAVARRLRAFSRPGDVVVVSVHWGENWGYAIPAEQVRFAHALIDEAGVDVVHGHSSHHAKGIEVYRGKLVLYGAGDLLNDYEGIGGHEAFRPELALLYAARVDPASGRLRALEMVPLRIERMSLQHASRSERGWLRDVLDREGRAFGTEVEAGADGALRLRWAP